MRDIRIIENMPAIEYHAIKAASSSTMKKLRANQLDFIDSIINPQEFTQSDQMILGEAVHCKILQPELYDSSFVVIPEGTSRATKAGKEFYASIESDTRARIKQAAHEEAIAIAENILSVIAINDIVNHPQAKKELTILWTDVHTNLPCKARIDICIPQKAIFLDIKTTSKGIGEYAFAKTIADNGYDRQAAWYTKALNGAFGRIDFSCALIAADTNKPYGVDIYIPDKEMLYTGKELYKLDLQDYKTVTTMIELGEISSIKSTLKNKGFRMISLPSWAKDLNRR